MDKTQDCGSCNLGSIPSEGTLIYLELGAIGAYFFMIPTLPLSLLSRVGKQTEQALKKLGLETVHDLLLYFPFRYDDFSLKVMIGDLKPGSNVNISGTVEIIQNKRSLKQRKNITEALISDESGTVKVVWFNQPFITKNLKAGDEVSLAGRITEK
jgi:ATP-dependent DNA helicase RecG